MNSMNGFDSKLRHGTLSGWAAHKNLGEQPCDPCYFAKQEYDKRRNAVPERVENARARARAQGRATRRLRQLHIQEYQQLYREEIATAIY